MQFLRRKVGGVERRRGCQEKTAKRLSKQLSFFKLCERQQNSYSIEQDRESQEAIFGVN